MTPDRATSYPRASTLDLQASGIPPQPSTPGLAHGSATPRARYRADVDGLRAIAVLSVLIFHMEWKNGPFSGGFVGVDIFFVISGYLISGIILSDLDKSRFSILSFYERRIRRIVPALVAVLATTCVLAYTLLLPSEMEDFSRSLLATIFSASNFYFWQHSSYFDSPLSSPLLHTWSLAVEEQFYLLFPLFLLLATRFFKPRLRAAVAVVAAVSFLLSAVGAYKDPNTTFYMLHTRAWELLLGTMLALKMFPPFWKNAVARNIATFAGLAAIGAAVHWLRETTPFPGIAALLPCVGSALIIGAGEAGPSLVSSALSFRPLTFIGLISYSLYLWHWPIIVFNEISGFLGDAADSHRLKMFLIILVSMVAATLSWHFVERPFRSGRLRLSGAPLFRLVAAVATAFVLFSAAALYSGGLSFRFSPEALAVASHLGRDRAHMRLGSCFVVNSFHDFDPNVCLHQTSSTKNLVLAGDSHAAVLWDGMSTLLPGTNVMEAASKGCKPYTDYTGIGMCDQTMRYLYDTYLPQHHVDALLIQGRWVESDIPKIANLVLWARLHSIPLVLLGPVQEYDAPLPRLLAYSINNHDPQLPYRHRVAASSILDRRLQSLSHDIWRIRYISLITATCPSGRCPEYADYPTASHAHR